MEDTLWSSRAFLIEEQGLPDKLAAQIAKEIDQEYAQELCALSREEMENRLAESLVETERAKREVQNNEAYKKAKEDVKYFEDALKDKVNPLKAVAALMLFKLDNVEAAPE